MTVALVPGMNVPFTRVFLSQFISKFFDGPLREEETKKTAST